MSLTILFQLPVDTGTAKISPKVEKANKKVFYLLTGKLTPVGLKLRRSIGGSGQCASDLILRLLLHLEKERDRESLINCLTTTSAFNSLFNVCWLSKKK